MVFIIGHLLNINHVITGEMKEMNPSIKAKSQAFGGRNSLPRSPEVGASPAMRSGLLETLT